MARGTVYFREVQRFRQWWLWAILLSGSLALVGLLGYGLVSQLVFDRPWGDNPISDGALVALAAGAIALDVAFLYFFYSIRLVTEVREDCLYVRFFPLVRREIPYAEIEECHEREYNALKEYGGWGVRWGSSGMAYNVRGSRGVQLVLKDGKRVLVGSQRAQELARAVQERLRRVERERA